VIALIPMGWILYQQPGLVQPLIGMSLNLPDLGQYLAGLRSALSHYGNFLRPSVGTDIVPAFSIAASVLMLFGALRVLRDHHSSRSYVLLIWLALLLPLISLHPELIFVLYTPSIVLFGIGIQNLIHEWYRLFPRNPYARAGALLPLGLLILSIVSFNYATYFYSYAYSPSASQLFSSDLLLAREAILHEASNKTVTVVVAPDQYSLFDLLRRDRHNLTVTTNPPTKADSTFVASTTSYRPSGANPTSTLVNDRAEGALRFLVYR